MRPFRARAGAAPLKWDKCGWAGSRDFAFRARAGAAPLKCNLFGQLRDALVHSAPARARPR